MVVQPTVRLTERDKASLADAKERLRSGRKLTPRHEAAVAKQRALAEQQAFIAVGAATPAELVLRILGANSDRELRTVGELVGVRFGKTVDLFELLRSVVAIAKRPAAASGKVARTYGELGEMLGMRQGDPERTLKTYHARGMPGRPATRGRANGEFEVELCRLWIALHVRTEAGTTDEDLRESRRRIAKLDLQRKENELLLEMGRLADVDEVGAYVATCVANSRAVLDGLPDELLAALPANTPEPARLSIHEACVRVIDTAFDELKRASHDDDRDATEDGD